jgi:hypothetical protein
MRWYIQLHVHQLFQLVRVSTRICLGRFQIGDYSNRNQTLDFKHARPIESHGTCLIKVTKQVNVTANIENDKSIFDFPEIFTRNRARGARSSIELDGKGERIACSARSNTRKSARAWLANDRDEALFSRNLLLTNFEKEI